MGIIQRQSLKSTLASYAGVVIGFINLTFLFPAFFTPAQIGLTQVLIAISTVLMRFSMVGANNLIVKFFPHFRDPWKGHNGFLPFVLLLSLIGFLLFGVLLLLLQEQVINSFKDKSQLVVQYFYLLFPLTFFLLYLTVFEVYLKANLRIATPIFIREFLNRFFITLIIICFYFQLFNYEGFINSFVLVHGLSAGFMILYTSYMGHLHLSPDKKPFRSRLFRIMIKYGAFNFLSGATSILVNRIDTIMLGALAGLNNTAIYNLAFFIATVIQIPQRNMNKIVAPIISQAWKDSDTTKIDNLYKSTSINQFMIGLLIFIGIWVSIDDLFQLIPKSDVFSQGKTVVLLIAMARLIDMVTGVNKQILETSKFFRFHFYALQMLVVLTILTNYLLIPLYSIEGAAIATLISLFIFNLIKFIYIWLKFKMQPFTHKTLQLIGAAALTLVIGLNIPTTDYLILNIVIRSIIVLILYSSLILAFNISQDATNFFWQSLRWLGIKK